MRQRNPRTYTSLGLATVICIFLLACGSETSTPSGDAPAAKKAATAQAEEGDDAKSHFGTIPTSFPSDLPTYPDATPGASMEVPGGGMLVTLETADSADDVGDYYRSELEAQGWTVKELAPGELQASKEGRRVRVSASAEDGGPTTISIGTTGS